MTSSTEDDATVADTSAAAVTAALEAFNDRRWDDFLAAYASDAVVEYPQSGERIAGKTNILGLVKAFPAPPRFQPTRIHRAVDTVVVEVEADYGDGVPWSGVFIYRVADGSITHERAYFAAPFEAPDWRAPFRGEPA
ncbi:MAG: nuclear transport factor 2 family protein [Acidimicrobiia bacterium]